MLEGCGGLEGDNLAVSPLGECGGLERTDFLQFLCWKGVVVLKELIDSMTGFFTVSTL